MLPHRPKNFKWAKTKQKKKSKNKKWTEEMKTNITCIWHNFWDTCYCLSSVALQPVMKYQTKRLVSLIHQIKHYEIQNDGVCFSWHYPQIISQKIKKESHVSLILVGYLCSHICVSPYVRINYRCRVS